MFDNFDDANSNNESKLTDKEQELARFADQLAFQANHEEEQQVPEWNQTAAFEQGFRDDNNQQSTWWQWLGIPALSMACSTLAIALVLVFFKPSNELDPEAFTALVNEKVAEQVAEQVKKQMTMQVDGAVAALVDLKLREFAAEQQVILANYRADMSNKQQGNNLQLASYILNASRKERKEDIGDFVSFINSQRKDEQLQQKIKYQQLEREINFQKINYQPNEKLNGQPIKQNLTPTQLLEQS